MLENHSTQAAPASSLNVLQQWQRVSPIALVYFCLHLLKGIFSNVSILAPLLLLFYKGIQRSPGYFMLALGVLIIVIATIGMMQYLAFRFRVSEDTVEIQSGLLRKKQLNLPFNRIQNVRLLQPLYYRFSNHLCVVLDTAGSNQQEARLAALPNNLAEALQQAIYIQHVAVSHSEANDDLTSQTTELVSDEALLCTRSISDLILYGISNNRAILVMGFAAPFYVPITNILDQQLQRFGIDASQWFNYEQQSWFWFGLAVIATTLVILLIITLFSIAASVLTYYHFRLLRTHDRYIRRSGLLTRHEISMKRSRLQWMHLQQDGLDKAFGRCHIHYEQIVSPLAAVQGEGQHGKIMVPALTPAMAQQLLQDVYPSNQLAVVQFNPINWRYILPGLVLICLPLLVASQVFFWPTAPSLAYLSIGVVMVIAALQILRWRRFGYAMDAEYFYLRRGLIGIDYFCVPLHKLQQLKVSQHSFMQRAGLRHLHLVCAAGNLTVPYMPAQAAYDIANYALYQVQASHRSWM